MGCRRLCLPYLSGQQWLQDQCLATAESGGFSSGLLLPLQVQPSLCCSQCFLHISHDSLHAWPFQNSKLAAITQSRSPGALLLHAKHDILDCESLTSGIWCCSRRRPCSACSCSSSRSAGTAHTSLHACAAGARPNAPPVHAHLLSAAVTCQSRAACILMRHVPRLLQHGGAGRVLE